MYVYKRLCMYIYTYICTPDSRPRDGNRNQSVASESSSKAQKWEVNQPMQMALDRLPPNRAESYGQMPDKRSFPIKAVGEARKN